MEYHKLPLHAASCFNPIYRSCLSALGCIVVLQCVPCIGKWNHIYKHHSKCVMYEPHSCMHLSSSLLNVLTLNFQLGVKMPRKFQLTKKKKWLQKRQARKAKVKP